MKKILRYIIVFLATFGAQAQIVNIPDPIFKNFLVNHSYSTNPMGIGTTVYLDANHDGQIQYTEAATYTSDIFNHAFYLGWSGITDLTGIEAFKSIEYLNVEGNQLTSLDISGCLSLKKLLCSGNLFATLEVNSATLETIDCNNSEALTALDVSGCPALKKITVQNNPVLIALDIDGCSMVDELRINFNAALTDLRMGLHGQLRLFQCYSNQITTLDISSCATLQYLFCTGNQLTSLNLANGNPQSFIQIIAGGYPNLTCIKVDNVAVSEFLWAGGYPYEFDAWASFNTDCTPPGPCIVALPDAHFKARLLANTAINTNGNNEIECTEAEAYTGEINADNANIADMTGIQAFKNITAFSCNNNDDWQFDTLDVSDLTALTSLSCTGNNFFQTLDISGCTALVNFSVDTGNNSGNELGVNAAGCTALTGFNVSGWGGVSLDLQGCTALATLNLDNKQLKNLNITHCAALTSLVCSNNDLTTLPLEGCTALTALNCSDNNIGSLSIAANPGLTQLDCSRNALTSLNVMDNTGLVTLNCADNQLPYLMVSNNPALKQLNCSHNNIGYLDVANNLQLTTLDCSHNNLTAQNISANTALLTLYCGHNNIGTLNTGNNTALTALYCESNNLTSIDMSHNPALKMLVCSDNQLTALDLTDTPDLIQLDCGNNLLTALNVAATPNLFQLTCKQNQLAALDLSGTRCRLLACEGNALESLNFANGYNPLVIMFAANDNPLLDCIQVDDAAYSTANWTSELFVFDSGVSFGESCALGMDEKRRTLFGAYPNPTKDVVYFSYRTDVQLYNLVGQKIGEAQDAGTFDLSGQPQGVYLLIAKDPDTNLEQRIKIIKE